jgi:hypothetical protein
VNLVTLGLKDVLAQLAQAFFIINNQHPVVESVLVQWGARFWYVG